MGTSISFRSPDTPRWRAAQAAYHAGFSLDRIRSEILNAAEGWDAALRGGAFDSYVAALTTAHRSFGKSLAETERPEQAIAIAVDTARQRALRESPSAPAIAVAERAFQRTLIEAARGERSLADTSPAEAAEAWQANRGRQPAALVQQFLREVFRQFGLHVVSRDAPALVGHERFAKAASIREFTRRVGDSLAEAAEVSAIEGKSAEELAAAWRGAVAASFERGRVVRE